MDQFEAIFFIVAEQILINIYRDAISKYFQN
jgi:hypothetical protein